MEQQMCDVFASGKWSHPVRVRGLELTYISPILTATASHPVRVRGLEQLMLQGKVYRGLASHPVRVRGLERAHHPFRVLAT